MQLMLSHKVKVGSEFGSNDLSDRLAQYLPAIYD